MTSLTISPEPSAEPVPQNARRRPKTSLRELLAFGWMCCAATVIVLAVLYREAIQWHVVTPLAAGVVVVLLFLLHLRRIEGTIPYFEIGAFYIAFASLYALYPIAKYVLLGYRYDVGDPRIVALQHYPTALGLLEWWWVLYLASFCVAYAMARGKRAMQGRLRVTPPDAAMIATVLVLFIGAKLFFVILGFFFNMRAETYMDTYLVMQRLPLVVRQIATQIDGIDLTLQIMLVVALTCAKRKGFRVILGLFLLLTTISHLLVPGGRIELAAVIIAALAAHHLVVRRLPFRWVITAGVSGFLLLMLMAALRSDQEIQAGTVARRLVEDYNEFEVIFGNAAEMKYWRDGEGVGFFLEHPNLYWSGIFAVIPQQILPVPKDTPWVWFTRTYYPDYYEAGGGMAFGVLAEAVAGFGWPELIWRGALVGILFGLLHRAMHRRQVSVYFFIFYIWLCAWSYLTLRGGTFAPLMMILYRILVPFVAVSVLALLLRRVRRKVTL